MKIAFNISLDDIVAFHEYYTAHSPYMRKIKWKGMMVPPICLFIVFSIMGISSQSFSYPLSGLAMAGVYAMIWPVTFKKLVRNTALKTCREGSNRGVLGNQELEITESGIVAKSEVGINTTFWAGIEQVAESANHGFIYLSSHSAHIIPMKKISAGDYRSFMDALRSRIKK